MSGASPLAPCAGRVTAGRTRPVVPLVLLAAVLAGCTGGGTEDRPAGRTGAAPSAGTPATASAPPAASAPAPLPSLPTIRPSSVVSEQVRSAAPPFRADTRPDTEQASGGPLTVVAVRAARQDGYDRVVLELAGKEGQPPGRPGWRVGYVATPTQQGSGRRVQVAGGAVLQVLIDGVGYPFDTGRTEATTDLTPTGTLRVREVDLQATYEGSFQAFVGLTARAPFRVSRLDGPPRVVVDVRHR